MGVSLLKVYESTLSTITSLDHAVAEGGRIRSRTHWAEEGEASTSYFFRLEKRNGVEERFSASSLPSLEWVLAHLSSSGWFCFTLTFRAPSSLTVTLLVTLNLLAELDRVAPCLLSSMF